MKKNYIILMYHSVVMNSKKGRDFYCLPLANFMEQMQLLVEITKSPSYEVVSFEDIHGPWSTVRNNIILTFDDGDESNYKYVYPILKVLGLKAYFFIIVSRVGKPGYMNWRQLIELQESGMIIGSHGMTHRVFTGLSDIEIDSELKDSKEILEKNLSTKIDCLSIPRGFSNKKILAKAKEAGYKNIFTSDLGNNGRLNPFNLKRIPVKRHLSLERFSKIIKGKTMLKENIENIIKKASQRLIGIKNYEKLTLKAYKWT